MTAYDATEQAYKNGYEKGKLDAFAEDKCVTPCADLNYEEEWKRKCAELAKAREEADWLRAELKSMDAEFARMRAQLDIVYLIFGGKNR